VLLNVLSDWFFNPSTDKWRIDVIWQWYNGEHGYCILLTLYVSVFFILKLKNMMDFFFVFNVLFLNFITLQADKYCNSSNSKAFSWLFHPPYLTCLIKLWMNELVKSEESWYLLCEICLVLCELAFCVRTTMSRYAKPKHEPIFWETPMNISRP